jgi:hypothetical protein
MAIGLFNLGRDLITLTCVFLRKVYYTKNERSRISTSRTLKNSE